MNPTLAQALAVAIGSAIGGVARWGVGRALNPLWAGFPLGTLAVNGAGGFMIGLIGAWLVQQPNEMMRLLLVTGFLGGLTTFSAFTGESLMLLQRGAVGHALLHSAAHLFGSLACAALGWWLGQALFTPR